jgi:hypothetical protein
VVHDEAAGRLGLADALKHDHLEKFPYTDGGVTMDASHFGQVTFASEVIAAKPATIYVPGAGENPVLSRMACSGRPLVTRSSPTRW